MVGVSFAQWHEGKGSTNVTQEETVVHRDHRGHKLGLAMKMATHTTVVDHVHDVSKILTWNSVSNEHMVAVNEVLGYAPLTTTIGYHTPRAEK